MGWRCRKTQDALAPYFDEQLSLRQAAAVEAHLAACPTCRVVLGQVEHAASLLHAAPPAKPPPSFAPRVKAHVRAVAGGPRSPLVRRGVLQGVCYGLVLGAAAAAVLAVFSTSFVAGYPGDTPAPQIAGAQPPAALAAPVQAPGEPKLVSVALGPAVKQPASRVVAARPARPQARSAEPASQRPAAGRRERVQPAPEARDRGERPSESPTADETTPPVLPGFGPPAAGAAGEGALEEATDPGPAAADLTLEWAADPAPPRETPPVVVAARHGPPPGGPGTAAISETSDVNLEALLSPQPLPD